MEDNVKVVYVRFDKNLDYKEVVNSYPIKKFLETVFGDFPTMISPTKFEFDRDKLGEFIQDEYDKSHSYVIDSMNLPPHILEDYCKNVGVERKRLDEVELAEFEPEILLDDHIVVIVKKNKVLGVFVTELDFGHIVDEL
jgi:hypothetical protein